MSTPGSSATREGYLLLADALRIPELRRRSLDRVCGGLARGLRSGDRVPMRDWLLASYGAANVAFTASMSMTYESPAPSPCLRASCSSAEPIGMFVARATTWPRSHQI